MKRHSIFLTISILTMLSFGGCNLFEEEAENIVKEISPNETRIKLEKIPEGKTVYLAKVNTGVGEVSGSNTKYLESITSANRSIMAETPELPTETENSTQEEFEEFSFSNCYIPRNPGFKNFKTRKLPSNIHLRASSGFSQYNLGDSKEIYVEADSTMTNYALKNAVLKAKGTNCYVWVIDGYFDAIEASGTKITAAVAEKIAQKFDSVYSYVRKVFGEESDDIYLIDMEEEDVLPASLAEYGDTGTKINIVIYDIKNSNTMGYFNDKDYYMSADDEEEFTGDYSIYNYSNAGKYFYIDSSYLNKSFDKTISTLVHEFQHMICFNQKVVRIFEHSSRQETYFDEMLSMLCEDLMQDKLGISDADSPKGRLTEFNGFYYESGLFEYNGSKTSRSYATSYAFGAWLARQYGGARLVQEMLQNDYVNSECFVNAVNKVNGTKFNLDDLVFQFLQAITHGTQYTHNKDSTATIDNYRYTMNAINLYSETYKTGNITGMDSAHDKYGPVLFTKDFKKDLRGNYGFSLHRITDTSNLKNNELSLEFQGEGSSAVKMYLIIQ